MSEPPQTPRKKITAEEFIKIWKGDYKSDPAYSDYYQKNWRSEDQVLFKKHGITGNIIIKNLQHLPHLILENSKTRGFSISNSKTGDFSISSSKTGFFDINRNSKTGDFDITENSKTGFFRIHGNSTTGDFDISRNSETGGFDIRENSSVGDFRVFNSKMGYFDISDNSKTGFFRIFYSETGYFKSFNSITGYYRTFNSTIGDFNIFNSKTGYFYIRENSETGYFAVNKSNIEDIKLVDSSIAAIQLTYLQESCKTLTAAGCYIGALHLKLDNAYQITVKESSEKRAQLERLNFDGAIFPLEAYLQIAQTDIHTITFNSSINHGAIVLSGILPLDKKDENGEVIPSSVNIINSDLGNTQFIGCKLDKFQQFVFKNGKMLQVFLGDTPIPDRERITTTSGDDEKEQRRLALGQFKKIYENQGDTVNAIKARADEMEVYRNQLRNKTASSFTREWWHDWGERMNLAANKTSTYHGKDWLRGVVVTLAFTGASYTIYCHLQGVHLDNPFVNNNDETFLKVFVYFFEYLNPLHNTDFFKDIKAGEQNNWALLLDYLSRIVIAYTVYQTVQAFRKFGKKS